MSNYTLHLKAKNNNISLPLRLKESTDFLDDYFDYGNGEYIYNDYAYSMLVTDDCNKIVLIDKMFINNEIVEDTAFLYGSKPRCIFLDCFGEIKIEVVISGDIYITKNTRVVMKEESINKNIINMIDYIYDNCDNYLYEEHKNSKFRVGVMPNKNISIDTKLALLGEIYDIYIKSYNILKYSSQTKLIHTNKIGNFNELQRIQQSTINYIVNHPEELQPVNYNSGISVNKQYYEPQKTLVQSVTYSYDIYENKVIVGFLKTIIKDLEEIKATVEIHRNINTSPYRRDGYVDSVYYIFTRNTKMLDDYAITLNEWLEKMQKLFMEYKKILNVSDLNVINPPEYTNIFRRIMPYNIMFEKMLKWFNSGKYDLLKSDLLLSFISMSKIYEYYCLLKIIRSLEKCGYNLISGTPFKYTENKYYRNTNYNNTFKFSKDSFNVTVYYQPIIYGKTKGRERPNNINIFRNTTISIKDSNMFELLEERKVKQGNYYTPDYLIKISKDNLSNYYILDAKYSSPDNIKRYQLPYLVFKYLFSISSLSNDNNISGMCIICGKTRTNSSENLNDIADEFNIKVSPNAYIFNVTGDDVTNDTNLINYINQIELTML